MAQRHDAWESKTCGMLIENQITGPVAISVVGIGMNIKPTELRTAIGNFCCRQKGHDDLNETFGELLCIGLRHDIFNCAQVDMKPEYLDALYGKGAEKF